MSTTGQSYLHLTGGSIVIGGILLANASSSPFDGPVLLFVLFLIAMISSQVAAIGTLVKDFDGETSIFQAPMFWKIFGFFFLGIVVGLATLIYLNLDTLLKC